MRIAFVLVALGFALFWRGDCQHGASTDESTLPPKTDRRPGSQVRPEEALTAAAPESEREPAEGTPSDPASVPTLSAVRTSVLVVDRGGAPVSDARVAATTPEERVELGITDADGELDAIELPESVFQISATRAGFANGSRLLEGPLPEQVTLVLGAAEATIRGFVLGPSGALAGSNVVVLAWDSLDGDHSKRSRARLAGKEIYPDPHTLTDEGGRFVLEGLTKGRVYSIAAVLPRESTTEDATRVRAGAAEPVELQLLNTYGTVVEIRDAEGSLPKASPRLFRSPGTRWSSDDPSTHSANSSAFARAYYGIDDIYQNDRWNKLLLYSSAEDKELLGPIWFKPSIPGYQPVEFELWAGRIRTPSVQASEVRLTPVSSEWGELIIEPIGAAPVHGPEGLFVSEWPLLTLSLRYSSAAETTIDAFEVPLRDLYRPMRISAIPTGEYRVSTRPALSEAAVGGAGGALRIVPGENRLRIDVSAMGWVRVHALDSTGREYDGALGLRLFEGDARHALSQFSSGPYVLGYPEPGSYRLELSTPVGSRMAEAPSAQIELRSGLLTETTLTLPD